MSTTNRTDAKPAARCWKCNDTGLCTEQWDAQGLVTSDHPCECPAGKARGSAEPAARGNPSSVPYCARCGVNHPADMGHVAGSAEPAAPQSPSAFTSSHASHSTRKRDRVLGPIGLVVAPRLQ